MEQQSIEKTAYEIRTALLQESAGEFFELTQNPDNFVYKLLRNSSEAHEMAVDGSSTAVAFRYTVPADRTFEFWRCTFHIVDAAIRADGFGGLAALGTGLLIRILNADESVRLDVSDGDPFTRHADFGHLAGVDIDADTSGVGGAQDNVAIRWTVSRAGRAMLLTEGQIVEFLVQDNLTGLTHFHAMVQGILR